MHKSLHKDLQERLQQRLCCLLENNAKVQTTFNTNCLTEET